MQQPGQINRTLITIAVGALFLLAIWLLSKTLLLVFAAVLIAGVLCGARDWLHQVTGIARGWCLAIVVLVITGVLGSFVWWQGPTIAEEAASIAEQITAQAQRLWESLNSGWSAGLAERMRSTVTSAGQDIAGFAAGFAGSLVGVASSILVVVATALFLAASPRVYVDGFLKLLPPRKRPRGREVLGAIGKTLNLWFLGQFIDMVLVTIVTTAGLLALGVPLAVTLGLIAGLLNFVPYIGALAGAVPAILVALAQSPELALWVALLFAVIQFLEGNLIAPLLQKQTVSTPPALTILSQTVFGTLFGLPGIVLATPLAAAALVAVRMIYVEDVLEDRNGDNAD
jgi:predicted PurR-regulated permease PerM